MKVLWFTGVVSSKRKNYGGGGWISSLSKEIAKNTDIDIALSYFYDADIENYSENGIRYYPMFRKERGRIAKLRYNWSQSYRKTCDVDILTHMQRVIADFQPDIIQIFGTESMFIPLIGNTDIPVVLYLQGLLNPIYNSFYPNQMNDLSVKWMKFDKNEWLLNNGIIRRHNDLKAIAEREKKTLAMVDYVIGRTSFDYQISRLYSPNSNYFKLNEMMRDSFYNSRPWVKQQRTEYQIFSTLSGVTYKGFDVILKAAKILKENGCSFRWNIAGLPESNPIVRRFEKLYVIKSLDVNVNYLGVLNESQLQEKLLDSDVMVHPSYIDNSPNSVCEAQLIGLPVIACYVGGVPDFIEHKKSGLLVPINDPYDIAYFIREDINKPYLYKYSEVAKQNALQRHSKIEILQNIESIYKSIVR